MAMSRSRGRTLLTSRSPMRIAPPSSGSSPASMRRAVDLPEPDGPTSTRSSPSPMSRSSLSTAGIDVPSYVRVAGSYRTDVIDDSSLDRTHRQATDHSLLGDPAGEHHGNAREHRRRRQLGQEGPARADVRGDPDGHRRAVDGVELDRVEELVPREDDAQQPGRRDAGGGQRQDDRGQLPAEAGAVDLRGLDQLARDLLEERPQHPYGEGEVDARVQDDQHQPAVEQVQVPRQDPDRQDRGDDRQELCRDEEEQDVAPLPDRHDRQRVRGGDRKRQDDQRRDEHDDRRVGERLAEGQQPGGATGDVAVAVERRMEEQLGTRVRVLLALERVEHHPEDREEEDQADDPGQQPERAIDPPALADDDRRRDCAHAISSPFNSRDSTRSATVATTIEAMTTTMLYEDARPNSQPPPMERWKTK